MPNAPKHIKYSIMTGALTVPVLMALNLPVAESCIVGASVAVNEIFLSPDLDTHSESYKKWKWLSFLWLPYQKAVSHRSWISHSGPLSYTIRFFYLFLVFLIGSAFISYPPELYRYIALFYIGGCISDTVHVALDLSPMKA